ncbi:acyltransferase family protein [Microbacterium sp. gxy059]|uniref:acyltransferase family protein n=1 Tax=Microbacterium sp. gxy059 TaxID=2957199 RepID=UPI003D9922CF
MSSTTQITPAPGSPAPGTTAPAKRPASWRPDIQGMRALAVGLVILAHVELPGFLGGFVGVDVFFVISGFLITQLLLREVERSGTVSIAEFYVRRARRILPAATLVAVAIVVYATFFLPFGRLQQTASDAGWTSVFLANWHFANERVDYFNMTDPSLFQHFWSLAVEEQFYVVWPLIVLAIVPRVSRHVFAGVTAALLAISLGWSMWFTASDATAAYFNTPARAYELAVGALLACLISGPLRSAWRHAAAWAGIALVAFSTFAFSELTPFPGALALVPVLGTALLLAAGPDTIVGRALAWRPLRYIGDISFSLYLWHWPVTLAVQAALPYESPYILRFVLTIGISVALSVLTFHFVEQPFQHKRVPVFSRDRRTLWLWPISVIVILATVFGGSAYADARQTAQQEAAQEYFDEHGYQDLEAEDIDGVQQELEEAVQVAESGAPIPPDYDAEALRDAQWSDLATGDCYASTGQRDVDDVCWFGDPEGSQTIALVGDSHAGMWLPALDILGKDHDFRVALFVKLSCGAYPVVQDAAGHSQDDCDAFREFTDDRIEEISPDAVVLGARGLLNMEERDGQSVEDQWSDAVRQAVEDFSAVADEVVALGDVPARPEAEPKDCVDAPGATQEDCVVTGESDELRSNELTQAAAEDAGAAYVDTTPLVCPEEGDCPLFVGDTPIYGDDSHLNRLWVEYVAPALGQELDPVLP